MSELMSAMMNTGMLQNYIRNAKVQDLEHHLDNARGTAMYALLKTQVQTIRGCTVRVERDFVRIH